MAYNLPGPKTAARLASGKKLFRHGLTYDAAAEESGSKGFIPPAQIILGKTKGDYVWDLDDNRFIDFQNGWATNRQLPS
jgi:4-aminobutyrate aminotransferase/(S)-3-amino-2-methylpropionate transaminase